MSEGGIPAAGAVAGRPVTALESGWRWLPAALAVIVLDQLTKGWIERGWQLYESLQVLPVLDITRLHNPGAAFSFLAGAGGWQRWAFTALALLVSLGILAWLRGLSARTQGLLAAGLALVLGGAVGNVIDRIEHGFVVDFIHVHLEAALDDGTGDHDVDVDDVHLVYQTMLVLVLALSHAVEPDERSKKRSTELLA